ncbi:MAG: helix-turn-helix domain-containing protein [Egibacteraceae bacterium]
MPRELLDLPPTLTVEHAARLCGIGRNAAYEAVAAGELPGVRIGRRWVVPTVPLLRMLGVEVAEEVQLVRGGQK